MTTAEALLARRAELLSRRKQALALLEQGQGDPLTPFLIQEELLDINARLRLLSPAKPSGRHGRISRSDAIEGSGSIAERQQYLNWTRRQDEDPEPLRQVLQAGLDAVTPRQREILLLHAEGFRVSEIARRLGLHVSTVSRTLKRARKKLACTLAAAHPSRPLNAARAASAASLRSTSSRSSGAEGSIT